ncbi:MAG: DUF305 domain-containing protein [Lachnospiraceae bacterium]
MQKLSDVTKDYLSIYYEDLEKMIEGMSDVELTDSISHDFIEQMIPHHKMAINMCENILRYTTNIQIQKMANSIIREQKESILDMEEVLDRCSYITNDRCELEHYQACFTQITNTMFCEMEKAGVSNSVNANFIREMIPHHLGAIKMCRNVLRFPICEGLLPIIHSIIKMQQQGVRELECIYKCLDC